MAQLSVPTPHPANSEVVDAEEQACVNPHANPRQDVCRVADALAEALARAGIDVAFGLPGGPIAPLNDAILDIDNLRAVTMRHENHAAFAAIGYARASGHLGVMIVTSGPGILNAITGIASAYCDGIPLLVLVGEVSRSLRGKNVLQDGHHLGIRQILGSLTKWTDEVPDAGAAVPMLQRALEVATSDRPGPVALRLPMDVLTQLTTSPHLQISKRVHASVIHAQMADVARAVGQSRHGVLFLGSGVRASCDVDDLMRLANALQWPVMTTPKAKGVFPETHPLSLGVFGLGGHPSTEEYLRAGIDTLLAIGTGLSDIATAGFQDVLRPRRTMIHVDIDAAQIGRNYHCDIAVAAPADVFIRGLARALPTAKSASQAAPVFAIKRHNDPSRLGDGPEGRIAPARAIWEMQKLMAQDTIFCVDSGEHFLFATHYLQIDRADAYLAMTGLGSMGSSISAIGVKLAQPERSVAMICGDGGFAMLACEISTAAQLGLEIAVFVFNDGRLGMVELGNKRIYGRTPRYRNEPFDIAVAARAMGAKTAVVRRSDELLALDLNSLLCGGPLVVDIHIDREATMPKNQRFEALGDVVERGDQERSKSGRIS